MWHYLYCVRVSNAGSREFCVDTTHTHGSNPARPSQRGSFRCLRRDPPSLRFGAALSCVVSSLGTGRDVGLAKSGFRPTGPGVVHAASPSPFRLFPGLPDVASWAVRHSLPEFMTMGRSREFQTTGRSRAFRTGPLSGLGPAEHRVASRCRSADHSAQPPVRGDQRTR